MSGLEINFGLSLQQTTRKLRQLQIVYLQVNHDWLPSNSVVIISNCCVHDNSVRSCVTSFSVQFRNSVGFMNMPQNPKTPKPQNPMAVKNDRKIRY